MILKNLFLKLLVWTLVEGLFTPLQAQEGVVPVVAIGEAKSEKLKVVFYSPTKVPAQVAEVIDILKHDFKFYKHKFDILELAFPPQDPLTSAQWDEWSEKDFDFVVSFSPQVAEKNHQLMGKVFDVSKREMSTFLSETFVSAKLRIQAHDYADKIYQKMTGKNSIFKTQIVFVSNRTSRGKDNFKELYRMDFDGRRVERLTFFNSTVISPAINPQGHEVLFSLIDSHLTQGRKVKVRRKNIDLKTVNIQTKNFQTLSSELGINSGAVFGPDGKKLYFTKSKGGNADIYELDLTTKSQRKVTTHPAEDVDPSISLDGKVMSFLSNRPGRAHIYLMNLDQPDSSARRVSFVGQFNATPRYSPDGKEIVFSSWVDNAFDLYRIDAQGNNLSRLTKDFGSNEEPWWSPDGEFLVFTSQRVLSARKASQDIHLMNREGEIIGQLTQDFGQCFTPRWGKLSN
jgi:TolB protein